MGAAERTRIVGMLFILSVWQLQLYHDSCSLTSAGLSWQPPFLNGPFGDVPSGSPAQISQIPTSASVGFFLPRNSKAPAEDRELGCV